MEIAQLGKVHIIISNSNASTACCFNLSHLEPITLFFLVSNITRKKFLITKTRGPDGDLS